MLVLPPFNCLYIPSDPLISLTNSTSTPSSRPPMPRRLHNHFMTSTVWDDFQFHADDIIISTTLKSGTIWMQQIASQQIGNRPKGLHRPT